MYEDYLEAAKKIPSGIGCGWAFVLALLVLPCSFWAGDFFSTKPFEANTVAIYTVMAIGAGIILFLMWSTNRKKQRRVAEIAAEKPGFKEFFAEYEIWKKSESMATVLTGLLVAGAAANAIQNYQMRQDIHEIVKRMKS
jgi:type II secretory pathway component PulF